jgi:hypothetical protein
MVYTCNPSYSGGRNQEDSSSKPTWANRPYLKKTHHKKGFVERLKVGSEFNQYHTHTHTHTNSNNNKK